MTFKAKSVLKDKFWIIENNEQLIGTMSWNDDRYMFSTTGETCFFDNKRQINQRFGSEIVWTDLSTPKEVTQEDLVVYEFPTSVTPYNTMYDVQRKLPLFTKSAKSKSLYCAGYYCIQFEKGWVKSFCPKQITIERYNYSGPFKTDIEMRTELSRVNTKSS